MLDYQYALLLTNMIKFWNWLKRKIVKIVLGATTKELLLHTFERPNHGGGGYLPGDIINVKPGGFDWRNAASMFRIIRLPANTFTKEEWNNYKETWNYENTKIMLLGRNCSPAQCSLLHKQAEILILIEKLKEELKKKCF